MKYKYVMFETDVGTFPVIFPEVIMHNAMAGAVRIALRQVTDKVKPVSAGFINLDTLNCYGNSASLKLDSRPEDTDIVRK